MRLSVYRLIPFAGVGVSNCDRQLGPIRPLLRLTAGYVIVAIVLLFQSQL
jgi:hypothetical protein